MIYIVVGLALVVLAVGGAELVRRACRRQLRLAVVERLRPAPVAPAGAAVPAVAPVAAEAD
jgi:hypothetical protein